MPIYSSWQHSAFHTSHILYQFHQQILKTIFNFCFNYFSLSKLSLNSLNFIYTVYLFSHYLYSHLFSSTFVPAIIYMPPNVRDCFYTKSFHPLPSQNFPTTSFSQEMMTCYRIGVIKDNSWSIHSKQKIKKIMRIKDKVRYKYIAYVYGFNMHGFNPQHHVRYLWAQSQEKSLCTGRYCKKTSKIFD